MIEAPDFLREAMKAAGVDVAAVEAEAARVDLDALEREHVLAEEAARRAKQLAAEDGDHAEDIPDPPAQMTLSDPDAVAPGQWHRPDAGAPDTEREAAIGQYPKSGTDRRRVLDQLAACGDDGATDEELSVALSMRLYTAAPRRNELVDGGWVEDTGRRRPTTTGSLATVWALTPLGRASWRPARP